MKKIIISSLIIIVMFSILLTLIIQLPAKISKPVSPKEIWSGKDQLEYANTLLAKGLNSEAARALEDYIAKGTADKKELARICYRLGNIYMGLSEYEKALKTFYMAEMSDKQADFTAEMNQRIVEALENLGMTQQAQYELDARTSLQGKTDASGAKAVARIGKDEILETEINKAIDKMPEWMKKNFENPESKLKFIREYVAAEVLYRKAKRLGLDKTPDTKDAVESFKKQVVVEQIMKKEIDKNLKISQEDVELYYKANKDKYVEPEGIKISYVELKDESKKTEALNQLKEGGGTKVDDWIKRDDTHISGIGEAKDVVAGLFLKEKGEFTDPFKVSEKFYIFFITDKRQKREKDFNEVKSQAEYEYKSKKQNGIMDSLLEKALEEQKVEILYEPPKEKDGKVK